MLEHEFLKKVVLCLQDVAQAFRLAKPALWEISESVVFVVALAQFVIWLLLRGH